MKRANAIAIGSLLGLAVLFMTVPPIAWGVCMILAAVVGLSGNTTRG